MNFDQEGVVNFSENVSFSHDAHDLFLFLDVFFLHRFHGVETICGLAADQQDLSI